MNNNTQTEPADEIMIAKRGYLQTSDSDIDSLRELDERRAVVTEVVGKGLYRVKVNGRKRLITEDEIDFRTELWE